jgi:hypothetical protein
MEGVHRYTYVLGFVSILCFKILKIMVNKIPNTFRKGIHNGADKLSTRDYIGAKGLVA